MSADEGGIEMKPDPEYTRKLLTAFEEAPEPTTDLEELQERGIDCESKGFRFHMQLLEDDGFVRREDGEWGLGLDRSADGLYTWNVLPLRLTASGHEFAQAMENSHGFQAVKRAAEKSLLPASLSLMRDVAVGALRAELAKHGFLP
jgi:hypothetical protein